jgi:putative tryptophan/tyrosine transport system substrate-binding protein
MRRRDFIKVITASAAAWPMVSHAQQGAPMHRIRVLVGLSADDSDARARVAAFVQGMEERGWTDGRNLQIDYRWAGPDAARIKSYATELVAARPNVIFALTSPSVAALKQGTSTIPIVFANIADPVGQGFVASLAQPGGNITGFTGLEYSIGGKWLDFLKDVAPRITRVAYVFNPEVGQYYPLFLKSLETAGATLGVEMSTAPVRSNFDVERAIDAVAAASNGGLIIQPDSFTQANHSRIIVLAKQYGLPAIYPYRYQAAAGGLVSYGPDVLDLFRRGAGYVDRLLRGEKPTDLPVQQPLKYELVVNLKTAKALGLTVPQTLLATANEVIE